LEQAKMTVAAWVQCHAGHLKHLIINNTFCIRLIDIWECHSWYQIKTCKSPLGW